MGVSGGGARVKVLLEDLGSLETYLNQFICEEDEETHPPPVRGRGVVVGRMNILNNECLNCFFTLFYMYMYTHAHVHAYGNNRIEHI